MRFSCFPEEKTLTPVHSWSRWPECKDACLVFRSRKNYVESKSQSGLLFPCFPSSPRVFCTRIYFFTDKSSVVFFCCCYFWLFLPVVTPPIIAAAAEAAGPMLSGALRAFQRDPISFVTIGQVQDELRSIARPPKSLKWRASICPS